MRMQRIRLPVAMAEPNDRVDEEAFDEDEDDGAKSEEEIPEVVDGAAEVGVRLERRIRPIGACGEEAECRCDRGRSGPPSRAGGQRHEHSVKGLGRLGRLGSAPQDNHGVCNTPSTGSCTNGVRTRTLIGASNHPIVSVCVVVVGLLRVQLHRFRHGQLELDANLGDLFTKRSHADLVASSPRRDLEQRV